MKSATINTESIEIQLKESLKQAKVNAIETKSSTEEDIGRHLKLLWECHVTAICIYKLNPLNSDCADIAGDSLVEMCGLFEKEIQTSKKAKLSISCMVCS